MSRITHPPFCKAYCREKHHDLLLATLNVPSDCKGAKKSDNGGLQEFESCVQTYLKKGWQKNDLVPDDAEDYRFPLIHWASVLGKTKALQWLIKKGFDPTVRAATTKETALHRSLLCLEVSEMFLQRKVLERKAEALIDLLKNCLILKDRKMETPLHVAARQMTEGRRKDHFEDCIKLLIAKIKEYYPDHLKDILNAQNSEGYSIVHLLACSEDAFPVLRTVINEGAVTSTTNTDGKTPLDIAAEKGSIRATALLKKIEDERMSIKSDTTEDMNGVAGKISNDEEKEQLTTVDKSSKCLPKCSCRVKKEQSNDILMQISQDNSTDSLDSDQSVDVLSALQATGLWDNVKELAVKKRNEDERILASKLEELQATNEAIEDAEKVVDDTRASITSKEEQLERITKELEKTKQELNYMKNEHQNLKRKRSLLNDECGKLEKKLHYCDSLLKVHINDQDKQDS